MREPAADPTVWMRPPPPSVAGALKMALSYLSNVACRISNPAFTVSCDEGRAVKSTSMPYKVDLAAFAITGLAPATPPVGKKITCIFLRSEEHTSELQSLKLTP